MTATHENIGGDKEDYIKDRIPERWLRLRSEIRWQQAISMTAWHILTVYFVLTFPYKSHVGLLLWALAVAELNLLGITGGVHRLWCHRSFKAKLPLRILLAALYYGAGQMSIYRWVKHHRLHHKYTDTDADPHNSTRGFFFAHIGWMVMTRRPDCLQKSKNIDMSDFYEDKIIATMDKYTLPMIILCCFIAPVAIPVYFFDASLKATIVTQWFMRYPYVQHAILTINSVAHAFGHHSYNRWISPTENCIVSFFSAGEGWHNYHHVFPWDYKSAEWNSVLIGRTTGWINLFQKIGWAYDLKMATPELVKKVVETKGDGSHPVYVSRADDDCGTITDEPCY